MKKRPLCMLCLTFLIIKGILLMMTGGDGLVEVPASSIFYEQAENNRNTRMTMIAKYTFLPICFSRISFLRIFSSIVYYGYPSMLRHTYFNEFYFKYQPSH